MTTTGAPEKLIFLPGIRGEAAFWEPVATRLSSVAPADLLRYPWASGEGPIDAADSLDALADAVAARLDGPTALVAQSLGGVVALLVAERRPQFITHLVLTATSGGVRTDDLGVSDWRPAFFEAYPGIPRWLAEDARDLSAFAQTLTIPTLLLWGDDDPISPIVIGERLRSLIPNSDLQVLEGGQHDLGMRHADLVAPLIAQHVRGARRA
ncbi:MAG: alpha/beta fold hydrolase [Vicinamibacterales bacterium]